MSLNGSGVAVINSSGQPVVASTLITSAAFNAATADLATMISTCLMKDGQQTVTANIPMGTFKFTGLGDGSLIQDSATIKNLQNGTGVYVATVGGTADVITLTTNPAITAYVAGQTFRFISGGANTTNVTVAISGLAAKAITKNGTTALAAGDIPSGMLVTITYDGTRFILTGMSTSTINGATMVAPVLSGTVTGTYTLAGTPTITSPTITGGTISSPTITTPTIASLTNTVLTTCTAAADPVTALGLATAQYVDKTVASYTGTANLAAGVGYARLSGATFTLTLGAVASNTNRTVTLQHQGTSLTQVYTIKGNGAESIIAPDGTANTYLLYTNGEEVTLRCDGTSWYVTNHAAQTDWVDAGVMTITGTGSDPTKPTTPDYDHVFWMRKGKEVYVKWILQISSSAGAADGSGAYLFATPTGIAIDSTITPVATAHATATMSEGIRSHVFGNGKLAQDSVAIDQAIPLAYSTTTLQWARDGSAVPLGSAAFPMTTNEMGYYLEAHFMAANWRV